MLMACPPLYLSCIRDTWILTTEPEGERRPRYTISIAISLDLGVLEGDHACKP